MLWFLLLLVSALFGLAEPASFSIDYERDTFSMDGEPFQYVSGSAHYFRMPRPYWRDRFRKMRAAGLNAVSTIVEWSQHEPEPGVYDFSGSLNLTEFVTTAHEEGLYTILRPGPYVCGEREMGGFPYWLLSNGSDLYLRTSDPRYTEPAERWLDVLFAHIKPLLYGNGGSIITVQVENEYGFYATCDHDYLAWLRDVFQRHIQDKAVLFTTDGAGGALDCGKIPEVYATVDFGPGTDVDKAFKEQRQREPKGPLVNSEFYPGWLTHWGEGIAHRDTADVVKTLEEILQAGANVNFYMFYGGTNFGFMAGANLDDKYHSHITSYDYDAPITEAGDLTDKYYAIRDVIAKYFPRPNVTVETPGKGAYGTYELQAVASFLSPGTRNKIGSQKTNNTPLRFENLGQAYGYLLYETTLPESQGGVLEIGEPRDIANIYINEKHIGTLTREDKTESIEVGPTEDGDKLSIVVENLGRVNFGGGNNDSKGLSKVEFDGRKLENWAMTSYALTSVVPVTDCPDCLGEGFRFYATEFEIDPSFAQFPFEGELYPLDTFLDVSGLSKGVVFINDHNLGRYLGRPQRTLYVPGVFLNASPQKNSIVVLEEGITDETLTLSFRTSPIFEK